MYFIKTFLCLIDCCSLLRVDSTENQHKVEKRFLGLYIRKDNGYFKEDKIGQMGIGLIKESGGYWNVSIFTTISRILGR